MAHSAGERGGEGVLEALESGERDCFPDPRADLRGCHAAVLQAQGDVLLDGAPREDRVLLEDVADLAARARADALAVDQDLAPGRRQERADHVEDGGLAAAGGAHDGHEFLVVDIEGHSGDGRDLSRPRAESLGEVPDGDADARHYLYLACAFLTNDMSTACLKGIGFSTARGTHTFMPRS